jgi:hypothetical protein
MRSYVDTDEKTDPVPIAPGTECSSRAYQCVSPDVVASDGNNQMIRLFQFFDYQKMILNIPFFNLYYIKFILINILIGKQHVSH